VSVIPTDAQIEAGTPPLRLGDVTTVVEDHQPLIGDAIVDDNPGVLLVIEKFPEADAVEVAQGVEEALDALAPGLSGIQVDSSVFRPATYLEDAARNIGLALLIGLVLVALAIGLFLRDIRAFLLSLLILPLPFVAGGLVLYAFDATINAMIVTGFVLALALIIDDVVVGVHNIIRRLRQPRPGDAERSRTEIVISAAVEGRGAIVCATLILLVALVPVLFIGGAVGVLLPSLALAYGLALLVSFVVALTVTPALAYALFSLWNVKHREPTFGRLRRTYGAILGSFVHRARLAFVAAVAVSLAVIAAGVALVLQPNDSLLPAFKQRDLLIAWEGAPGTSLPEMNRVVSGVTQELREVPGVSNVGAHVGRAVMADQVVGMGSGVLWVSINPNADYDETVAAIREVADGYPGFRHDLTTYPLERLNQVLPATDNDITVRVYGEDQATLRSSADQVANLLAETDGVIDPRLETQGYEPSLQIEVDLAAAERAGIKPGDVRRAAATLLSGIGVGALFEDQKVFDVVVWGVPAVRRDITGIQNLLIDTPIGGRVRLGDVAQVRVGPAPTVIQREGVSKYVDVVANVDGRDAEAVTEDIEAGLQRIEFPLEYHAELQAHALDEQATQSRMFTIAAAVGIAILLLMQAFLGRWRLAFALLLCLPAALAGGVAATFIADADFSLGSLLGFFTVLALGARQAMVLLDHYRVLRREEGAWFGTDLALRGAQERLGPILMTALATALAVLPFVLLGDRAGYELIRPMSIAILGGLITSTVLILFLVPALYLRFGPTVEPEDFTEPAVEERDLSMA
jgi:Cu/Ag efflux pump CusA